MYNTLIRKMFRVSILISTDPLKELQALVVQKPTKISSLSSTNQLSSMLQTHLNGTEDLYCHLQGYDAV
jgi:hypothetical protein